MSSNGFGFLPLRKRQQFVELRKAPRCRREPFIIQGLISEMTPKGDRPNPGRQDLSAGFTVTKKTGNAVARNRIRRRLRHALGAALRANRCQGKTIAGRLVLIGHEKTLTTGFDILTEMIVQDIDRLRLKGKKAVR